MRKFINILFIIPFFAIACNSQTKKNTTQVTNGNEYTQMDLTDTIYFNLVKNYISEKGIIERVNGSSDLSTEMIVEYHIFKLENWKIIVDHTNRIYMTLDNTKYGNILSENSIVGPEINYGVPDTNPQLTKEKEVQVLKNYKRLILLALGESN